MRVGSVFAILCLFVTACSAGNMKDPSSKSRGTPTGGSSTSTTSSAPAAAAPANAPSKYTPVPWPNLPFRNFTGGLGDKVVALTFDDGPDKEEHGGYTNKVLDFLKSRNLKATFFLCGNVWSDVGTDLFAQMVVKRIVAEGHTIGNHTMTHATLNGLSPADMSKQFDDNEKLYQQVLGQSAAFTLIRAPFGKPFQDHAPELASAAPATAPYGVHIGWGFDTDDWKCAQSNKDSDCIMSNLNLQISKGNSGPILMHAVYKLTVDTLPQIIDALTKANYRFVSVEDLVTARYGASSKDIVQANKAKAFAAQDIINFSQNESLQNVPIDMVF